MAERILCAAETHPSNQQAILIREEINNHIQ
jgi:hypothetical protein